MNDGLVVVVPHSCEGVCQRPRAVADFVHKWVELCLAGPCPCPPYTAMITVLCPCAKTSKAGKSGDLLLCG